MTPRWLPGERVRCRCHGEEYTVERRSGDLVMLSDGAHHGPLMRASQTGITWDRAPSRPKRKATKARKP
jgi:hypothetical protein